MHDGPSAAELAEAVREFLESEVLPVAQDARLRFRVLVAANALSIVKRDLELRDSLLAEEVSLLAPLVGPPPAGTPWQQALALSAKLCSLIRGGEAPRGTLAALRRVAELKLRAASPRYLERER
jgi:Domain of unknown function (DUF6285)